MNFFVDLLNIEPDKITIMPFNFCPSKIYEVCFTGWKGICLSESCATFSEVVYISSQAVKAILKTYKDTHAFTEPMFCLHVDGTVKIKIGTLEIERYENTLRSK